MSLAQDTGSEMLYPLLPTFITGVLGAPVVAVGVAEGLADAAAAVMKLVSGRLAGSHRRRRWIAAGYAIATVGKVIVSVAFVWPVVLLGRTVDRIGKGIRGVPRDALIAEEASESSRGRAFGFHRALDTTGAVIGPLLGLVLLKLLHGHIRPALVIAVIPAAISVGLVGLVREHRSAPTAATTAAPGIEPTSARVDAPAGQNRQLPAAFWSAFAPLAVFAFVNSTDALLLQRAAELGLSVTSVVFAYVLYNVVYASLSYPAGKLADRVPPGRVFAGGLVVFGVVYLGLGISTSAAALWVLLPLYGAYTAFTDGVSRAWVSGLVGAEQRTWALGLHGATTGVGALAAGIWSGLAWHHSGRIPLVISGAAALCVAAWLLARREAPRRASLLH